VGWSHRYCWRRCVPNWWWTSWGWKESRVYVGGGARGWKGPWGKAGRRMPMDHWRRGHVRRKTWWRCSWRRQTHGWRSPESWRWGPPWRIGHPGGWGTSWRVGAGGRPADTRRRQARRDPRHPGTIRRHSWRECTRRTLSRRGSGSTGFRLRFELCQGSLSGISDLWFLSMQLFLRHLVHEKPERGFGSDIDGTESFGLSVDPIFIELDFDEVCHSDAGHTVRDVGVSCPPCQVPNVSLKFLWCNPQSSHPWQRPGAGGWSKTPSAGGSRGISLDAVLILDVGCQHVIIEVVTSPRSVQITSNGVSKRTSRVIICRPGYPKPQCSFI